MTSLCIGGTIGPPWYSDADLNILSCVLYSDARLLSKNLDRLKADINFGELKWGSFPTGKLPFLFEIEGII